MSFSSVRQISVIIFLGVLVASSARQATADERMRREVIELDALLVHALANSPLVASIDASFGDRLGAAIETGQLRNPQLEVGAEYAAAYTGERPDERYSLSLSQPLRASDFGSRAAVKQLLEKAATQQQQYELLELSQNIRLQYVKLWALMERSSFVREMRTLAARKATLAARGQNKGFLGTSEVKLLQGAAARLKLLELGLSAEISQTEAALTKLSGFTFSNYRVRRPELFPLPTVEEALRKSRENKLGARQRIDLLERVADKQMILARKDSFPEFTPSVFYEHEDNSDFVGVGVSFELPFFSRNQGEILRSERKSRELKIRKDYLRGSGFESEVEAVLRTAKLRIKQARTYEKEVFPLFRQALGAAERQFESGQTSVLQLWQAFLSLSDANEEQLALWVNAYGARSELSLMLGEE